jgi:hypothetical protein
VTFDWDKMSAFVKDKVSDGVFFSLYSVTFSDVLKELKNLDISKSTGIDGLGSRNLKLSAPLIADSLTHIKKNLSLCTGIFPIIFKKWQSYSSS